MEAREKKGLIVFAVVLGAGVFGKWVYPDLIRPVFDYGDRLKSVKGDLEELEDEYDDLEMQLQKRYREYVLRSGSTDPSVTKDELFYGITGLLHDTKLKDGTVSPKAESIDRKSNVATLKISVSARGTFAQCIDFVRAFYKMPYIARLNSLKLDPTAAMQRANHDEVQLDAEIEARVLPTADEWGEPGGEKLTEYDLVATKNLTSLRNWKPFSPYVAPSTPTPRPRDDDKQGKPSPPPRPPTPPPPRGPEEWPDADEYVFRVMLRSGSDEYRMRDALLENMMDNSTRFVSVGEDFDGGELVFLHAMGAVVHKMRGSEDFGYWVYPIGQILNTRVKLDEAAREWPEIYIAMQQYLANKRVADEARAAKDAAAAEVARLAAQPADDADTSGVIDAAGTNGVPVDSNGIAAEDEDAGGTSAITVTPAVTPKPNLGKTKIKTQRPRGRTVQGEAGNEASKAQPGAKDSQPTGARNGKQPKIEITPSAKRPRTRVPPIRRTPEPADSNKETDDVAPPE